MPYRVLLQDYTGVPLIVDLAAMRDAISRRGKDPSKINSIAPLDLVIDHSVQVDSWGSAAAFEYNIEREYERNSERYALLKWAQDSFKNMRVFPPGKGICHQVNLEHLSAVVAVSERDGRRVVCPDTLVGTDSHTPMVNGLGVLGWGVGGIEAEAVMLGEPYHMPIPEVLEVDMDKVQSSIACPRNPEERRDLRGVPAFARSLIADQRKSRKAAPPARGLGSPGGGMMQLLREEGPGQSAEGLADGSVV